jgi:hypothetical protein
MKALLLKRAYRLCGHRRQRDHLHQQGQPASRNSPTTPNSSERR